jgi:hypothetical protein
MTVFNAGSEVNSGGEIPVEINRDKLTLILLHHKRNIFLK